MKVTDVITEAASPAQQAAIAVSMKKAGKKPKQGVAEGFPHDVDHMPGPVIRNADMTTDNVKTKDKAEWDRATDSINARVFDDMSEFRTDSKGETVVGDSAVWAKWDNATQTGWFNAKGRPLKPWPIKEQGVAEGSLEEDKGMTGYNAFKREWRAKHGADAKVPAYDSKEYTSYVYRQNDKKQGMTEGSDRIAANKQDRLDALENKLIAKGYTRTKDPDRREYQYKWTKDGAPTYVVNYRFGSNGYAEFWKEQGVAEEASPMIKPPANRFDNKQEAFDYAKEHGGKVFKSTYIDPNTGIKNIIFVVKKEQGVVEGSGPKEKQKTPYRDINSPEYRAAADKQKQRMAKDKAAEPGKKLLAKKGVAEHTELAEEFDLIESIVEMIAEHNGVDAEVVWADLESLTEDELYVFAVTSNPLMEDWQKANKRDKTDGMSQKAVNAYRRENPGSKLKTAVTTKPSKLKKGGKASKRRKSYCSRSRGQMKMHSISCAKTPDKAICKARRRWNC